MVGFIGDEMVVVVVMRKLVLVGNVVVVLTAEV